MLHQKPSDARSGAVPVIDLGRELQVFDALPPRCIAHMVEDGGCLPKLRPGEVVVVDPRQREVRSGAVVLVQWRPDAMRRSLLQTNYRRFGGRWRPVDGGKWKSRAWMVDPINRATSVADLDHRIAAGHATYLSDGPYTRERLKEATVGRVIGILTPAAAASLTRTEALPAPTAPAGFDPAVFCCGLSALGGSVMVELSDSPKVGFYIPAFFDYPRREDNEAAHAAADEISGLVRDVGVKACLRSFSIKVAREIRLARPTGEWSVDGVTVLDRALSRTA